MKLTLERRSTVDQTGVVTSGGGTVLFTPPIDEDYWKYRVKLSETQAIVGFPKFGTVGIGFAVEEDWNTNLPYTCSTDDILSHILHNKGDDAITVTDCLEAIKMVQHAATTDRKVQES